LEIDLSKSKIIICGIPEIVELITPTIRNHNDKQQIIIFTPEEVNNQIECERLIFENLENEESFLISAYWPWKFSNQVLKEFKSNSLNFHPSPLPKDRGWYPHVHQIRKNTMAGITLHVLESELDVGPIWIQKDIKLSFPITAGEAHTILKKEIVSLFNKNWSLIIEKKLTPQKQLSDGNFHSKFELDNPEIIEIEEGSKEETFLRILSSRNIGKKSFIKIKYSDESDRFIHISYSDDGELI
jgi:methionyl-tRNA formyltransferase